MPNNTNRGKKPNEEDIKKVIFLLAKGEPVHVIQKALAISRASIYNYKEKYKDEIALKKEELADREGNDKHEIMTVTDEDMEKDMGKPQGKPKEKKKKEEKPKFAPIEDETTRKAISKASESVSKIIEKETVLDFQASQVIKSARLRYQQALEHMGIDWNEFIAAAIRTAYHDVEENYIQEITEMYRDQEIKELELLQAYHDMEVEEDEQEEGEIMEE